jgi:uncharacterized membrane protein
MEKRIGGEPLETSRLTAFSDGIFAVAITLLVLNIQVPSERISLPTLMAQQAPAYAMFILTFAIVGIKWLNHHRMFTLIREVDTTLNVLNILLLLGVCVVPFTAALLAKYMTTPDGPLASLVYGALWAFNGLLYTAIVAYAQKKGFAERRPEMRRMTLLYLAGPLGYLVSAAVSFLNIYVGVAMYLAIVLLYLPPQRVPRAQL